MLPTLWALLFLSNAIFWGYAFAKLRSTGSAGSLSFSLLASLLSAGTAQLVLGNYTESWDPLWSLIMFVTLLVVFPGVFALLRSALDVARLENERNFLATEVQGLRKKSEGKVLTDYIVDISALSFGNLVNFLNQTYQEGRLLFPYFVVKALQTMLSSNDDLTKARGQFALQMVERLTKETLLTVETIRDEENGSELNYEQQLLPFLEKHQGYLLIADPETLQTVQKAGRKTIYLPAVAQELQPNYFVGQILQAKIVERGKEPGQGVAYLSDGSSLIIDGGETMVGRTLTVKLSKVFQTVAGKTLYGEIEA